MTQVVVGRIARPHGVRGEVVVEVRTDEPEQRFTDGAEFESSAGTLRAESVRWHKGRPMLTLAGVVGREGAEALRGVELTVDLPPDELTGGDDQFHDTELIGLRVVEGDGTEIGTVSRVDHGPAHETLVVKRKGARSALIPFVEEMIDEVDLEAETIVVDLPPGLLEL